MMENENESKNKELDELYIQYFEYFDEYQKLKEKMENKMKSVKIFIY